MTSQQITYLVFGLLLLGTLLIDLWFLTKRSAEISIRKAMYQTVLWVTLAFLFMIFIWAYISKASAVEYISAYLMEWSLSIDNIFVFIVIFSFFKIRSDHIPRALLIGILLAIIFRLIFITTGIALITGFFWMFYLFGAFLIYTGIRLFTVKQEQSFRPENLFIYKYINQFFLIIPNDEEGKFIIKKEGRTFYTYLFVVVILLATADIIFAVDSIPAVLALTRNQLVIYTSNIFAVLGLRSLFFLLKGAIGRFEYLQQGIAIILIFIGIKMIGEKINLRIPAYISLMVIIICLFGSIAYSLQFVKRKIKQ